MPKTSLKELREAPAYGLAEAAHYLSLPTATLRSWVLGRSYPTRSEERRFAPLIEIADRKRRLLSFLNLVEAHVLAAIRRQHNIALPKVRTALDYTQRKLSVAHPLADQQFETDGVDLFVRKLGELITASQSGQLAMAQVFKRHLTRIERDTRGLPIKLYPFTRTAAAPDQPEMVVIDPRVSFGRPVLAGTGIPTAVLAERYKAGDSIEELADDYGADRQAIEEAIRCELPRAA